MTATTGRRQIAFKDRTLRLRALGAGYSGDIPWWSGSACRRHAAPWPFRREAALPILLKMYAIAGEWRPGRKPPPIPAGASTADLRR